MVARIHFLLAVFLSFFSSIQSPAAREEVIVGVNRVNLNGLPRGDRERIIRDMVGNGVRVARLNIVRPTGEGIETLRIARANGLRVILNIGVLAPDYLRAGAVARPAARKFTARPRLSDVDIDRFEQRFTWLWHEIEKSEVSLAAIEFSNELNWADFNGDLAVGDRGTVYDGASLAAMPGREAFERGLDTYIAILKVARKLRDASLTLKSVPIVSAGLADIPPDWAGRSGGDAVDGTVFLDSLRRRGLLDIVDGIGLHLYPAGERWQARLRRQMEVCGDQRAAQAACWITEWGVANPEPGCPTNDQPRADRIRAVEAEFRAYSEAGRLKALIYYDWDSDRRFSIWRCDRLTPAGQAVLD